MPFPSDSVSGSRNNMFMQWLAPLAPEHGLDLGSLAPVSGDASFRHYFRLTGAGTSCIAMDAPPDHEDNAAFVHVAGLLRSVGIAVPDIVAHDQANGFLLISDLGRRNVYQAIQEGMSPETLQMLYRQVIGLLVAMQKAPTAGLPVYDRARLLQELELFPEWYVARHCGVQLDQQERSALQKVFETLVDDNVRQPTVFVHRDFHSPNIMLDEQHGETGLGIIDFQDALAGPLTYDLASLVMDARTSWDEAQQLDWAIRYWQAARDAGIAVPQDFADFHQAYEWMSLQRNLRILGVFARLSYRDGKHHYLEHIPRVVGYVRQVGARYSVFRPLLRLMDRLEARPETSAS